MRGSADPSVFGRVVAQYDRPPVAVICSSPTIRSRDSMKPVAGS
jgi:hypothetical protein